MGSNRLSRTDTSTGCRPRKEVDRTARKAVAGNGIGIATNDSKRPLRIPRDAENKHFLIHQDLALLAESQAEAFQHLDQAEAVLQGPGAMSEADRIEQLARILRLRARLAAEAGNLEMAGSTVARLQKMVRANPNDNGIERAYNGANGALLAKQSKFGAAIEALQEDPEDPFSLAKLAELLAAWGNVQDAAEISARLKADYGTSLEDWLVVRKSRP